jgi:hypothetical protein
MTNLGSIRWRNIPKFIVHLQCQKLGMTDSFQGYQWLMIMGGCPSVSPLNGFADIDM